MRKAILALVGAASLSLFGTGCVFDDDGDHHDRYNHRAPARASENFKDKDRDGIRDGLEDRDRDGIRDGFENGGPNRRDPERYR